MKIRCDSGREAENVLRSVPNVSILVLYAKHATSETGSELCCSNSWKEMKIKAKWKEKKKKKVNSNTITMQTWWNLNTKTEGRRF